MTIEEQIDEKARQLAKAAKESLAMFPNVVRLLGPTLGIEAWEDTRVKIWADGGDKYPWHQYEPFHHKEGNKGLKFLEKNLKDMSQVPMILAKGSRGLGLFDSDNLIKILAYALETGFKADEGVTHGTKKAKAS